MTWLLLAFTGWAISITTQSWWTCVAHWFANVANIMGYETTADQVIQNLWVSYQTWYNVWDLPKNMTGIHVSQVKQYTKQQVIEQLSQAPLLWSVFWTIESSTARRWSHTFAVVWWNNSWIVMANSYGTRFGLSGYDIIEWKNLNKVWFQNVWYKPLTWARLIQIERKLTRKERIAKRKSITNQNIWISTTNSTTSTEKKEDLQESKQVEKSPTINARNTRKRYLKPLD